MSNRALAALAAVVLLAPAASAQTLLDSTRVYALAGNGAPERLLFPTGADPTVVVGLRLTDRLDLQVGGGTWTDRDWSLDRTEVAAYTFYDQTRTVVAALGMTGRLGRARVRGSVSAGFDRYTFWRSVSRPDSVDVYYRGEEVTQLERGVALVYDGGTERMGRFGHVGTSAELGLPIGRGRVRFVPALGVMASASAPIASDLEAQAARAGVFVRLPVRLRVRGVVLTAEAVVGGHTKLGDDDDPLTRRRASGVGAALSASTLRIDF